jgi:hypothetical protein
LPGEEFFELITVSWGGKTSVMKLVDIFSDHEEEHTQDIIKWLKQLEKQLGKAGKNVDQLEN